MAIERIRDEGQTLGVPTGKVLGIVDSRAKFDELAQAFKKAGFEKEYGDLRRRRRSVSRTRQHVLLQRFGKTGAEQAYRRTEGRQHHRCYRRPPQRVDEAVQLATQHGARRLVHFGRMTITWHTK